MLKSTNLLTALCAMSVINGCSAKKETPPSGKPNILWIYIEDMNPRFGCYGDQTVPTPHIGKDLFDNTIIIFSSDNGSYRQASNRELRAVKSYIYEGGIRVPGIFHWPALKNKSDAVINEAAGLIDIFPTVCDILQVEPPRDRTIDGTSILSLLKGEDFERKNPLNWFFYRTSPEIALRIDNYMIMGKDDDQVPRTHGFAARDMTYIKNMNLEEYELYDLNKDISQSYNLIDHFHNSEFYIQLINKKLKEIQIHGYHWEQIPSMEGMQRRRIKTEFNPY